MLSEKWKKVEEIGVIRSDSDPSSNYVVCSRICQQIHIADLIIIDVSSQNANVFYEFGMAVALGKMILPICYSESFYKMVIPKAYEEEYRKMDHRSREMTEKHIGFYPWRKELFEYYGIRYRSELKKIIYFDFDEIIKSKYGFSDEKYNRFPYHEILVDYSNVKSDDKDLEENSGKKIGNIIYDKLKDEYNKADGNDNTLVVYTMDAFLNEEQAGLCIVNFYRNITARMRQEKCFCGERVGVLVQENVIPESEKDAKEQLEIFYNVGELIQIGVNQATFMAAKEIIKSDDSFETYFEQGSNNSLMLGEQQRKEIKRFVKGYIKNRAIRIYPNNPVYVDRMKNLFQKDILRSVEKESIINCSRTKFFCLYHVMLRTLSFTNEIVVDVSNNCLQSLFWLGAAHGLDINAITVMYEKTDQERNSNQMILQREKRYVFDVAGLWMAILRKNDTEKFYVQLALAQNGIERHSKLMLSDSEYYKKKMVDCLFSHDEKKIKILFTKRSRKKQKYWSLIIVTIFGFLCWLIIS